MARFWWRSDAGGGGGAAAADADVELHRLSSLLYKHRYADTVGIQTVEELCVCALRAKDRLETGLNKVSAAPVCRKLQKRIHIEKSINIF